jgi:hypothetical protein
VTWWYVQTPPIECPCCEATKGCSGLCLITNAPTLSRRCLHPFESRKHESTKTRNWSSGIRLRNSSFPKKLACFRPFVFSRLSGTGSHAMCGRVSTRLSPGATGNLLPVLFLAFTLHSIPRSARPRADPDHVTKPLVLRTPTLGRRRFSCHRCPRRPSVAATQCPQPIPSSCRRGESTRIASGPVSRVAVSDYFVNVKSIRVGGRCVCGVTIGRELVVRCRDWYWGSSPANKRRVIVIRVRSCLMAASLRAMTNECRYKNRRRRTASLANRVRCPTGWTTKPRRRTRTADQLARN